MAESYKTILDTLTDPRLRHLLCLADNVVTMAPPAPMVAEPPPEYFERRSEMWGHVRKLVEYVGSVLPAEEDAATRASRDPE